MLFSLEYYTRNWVARPSGLFQANRTYGHFETVSIRQFQNLRMTGNELITVLLRGLKTLT